MDFTTKQWFVGIIVMVIITIIVDGLRRMRKARQDSLQMSLKPKHVEPKEKTNSYGSEFPNGGARPSQKTIDKTRINEVRSQYDFGRDMSAILEEAKEKLQRAPQENNSQWADDEDEEEYYTRKWDEEYEEPIAEETYESADVEDPSLDESVSVDVKKSDVSNDAPKIAEDAKPKSPKQVPLNLEESVPVLMDTVEEDTSVDDDIDEPVEAEPELPESPSVDLGDDDLSIRSVGKHIKPAIEPTIDDEGLDTRSANKPKYQSKYFSSNVEQSVTSSITEVLVINVRASKGRQLQGSDLLEQVLANGLRYGAMNVFHRHADEDGEGPILFSMANMLKPGTFDLKSIDHFTTVGVTFFLTLPVFDNQNMAAFEAMLTTAKNVASSLQAELNDDQRSVMTAQTMEHYRERIRDFARRQQLEKNK